MRFGCCVLPNQIDTLARAGYDFCELPARAVLPFEDDAAALPALREIAAAKRVCARCRVAPECLDWALRSGQTSGVWGGTCEQERDALLRTGTNHARRRSTV